MICRYLVECPGCNTPIMLRVSVGLDIEQPFYFVCEKCNASTRGKQVIAYQPVPKAWLELEEAKLLEVEVEAEQVINIHPDLPSICDAKEMWDKGGSPYFMQRELLGKRFDEFYKRLKEFRGGCESDWLKLKRWLGYYVSSKWQEYDAEGKKIFEETWPSPSEEWMRHDFVHKALDHFFAPLWVEYYYVGMKEEWCGLFSSKNKTGETIQKFVDDSVSSGEIAAAQRDVFHCLELFVANRSALLPALPALMYAGKDAVKDLRLFRDDFPKLRDLYVTTFETCHKNLRYVLAVVNAIERGDVENFDSPKVKTMAKFDKLPNAQKAKLLSSMPVWGRDWAIVLDRELRNAMAHHSIRHDLASGTLVDEEGDSIPYLEFVMKSLNLIHPILLMANVLKTLRVMNSMYK